MADILIIDDNMADAKFIEHAINSANPAATYKIFEDGREFVDYVETKESPSPRLVVIDIKMQRMGGFEALSLVNSLPKLKDTNFVVMSDSVDQDDINKSYTFLRTLYFNKPPRWAAYKKIMHSALKEAGLLVSQPNYDIS